MSLRVEGSNLLISGIEVTGSQKAASGKKAQQIADFFWPDFSADSLSEELKLRVDSLQAELQANGVTAEMVQSAINYLGTAKTKHARSTRVNTIHINLVIDLLRTTRDQMFPEFTKNW